MKNLYIAKIAEGRGDLKVKHYSGLGPEIAEGSNIQRGVLMPRAEYVVIAAEKNEFFLFRYTKEGTFCGDTWHLTLEDAKHQASFEYEELLGEWQIVPDDIEDIVKYIFQL